MLTVSVLSGNFFQTLPVWLFDTSFHTTMPEAYRYPLPTKYTLKIRSVNMEHMEPKPWVCIHEAANFWVKLIEELKLITIGNGASITAVDKAPSGYFYGLHLLVELYGNTYGWHRSSDYSIRCNIQMTLTRQKISVEFWTESGLLGV